MKIAFACPNCAKQLVADVAAAGRTGRCRHCGKPAVVPSGYTLRPITPTEVPQLPAAADWGNAELGPAIAFPAVAPIASASAPKTPSQAASRKVARTPARAAAAPAAASQGGSPVAPGFPVILADAWAAFAAIVKPSVATSTASGAAPAPLLVAYRSFFALLGRVTTWISETSYTVSFILITLAIASGMVGRHSLAAMACGAIVALNLVGLAGDVASLVTLSFRKNPLQGTLFLLPPFTLYYLWTDWRRYRDTIDRMRIPLVTLAVVAVAYVFVPWLRGGSAEEGRFVAAVKQAVATVEEKLAGRQGAIDEGLKQARAWLREVPLPDPSVVPGLPGRQQATPAGKP
ncbi:MAG: hypothetical protein RLZZ111_1685 [Planctomycetota bacterium]